MDLESLQARKKELEATKVNLSNSWQIVTGHLQECEHWINYFSNLPVMDSAEDETSVE